MGIFAVLPSSCNKVNPANEDDHVDHLADGVHKVGIIRLGTGKRRITANCDKEKYARATHVEGYTKGYVAHFMK